MVSACLVVPLAVLAVAAAQDNARPQFFFSETLAAFTNPWLAQGTVLLRNDGFAVTATAVTCGALWLAEGLTRASVEAARRALREALPPGCPPVTRRPGRADRLRPQRLRPRPLGAHRVRRAMPCPPTG